MKLTWEQKQALSRKIYNIFERLDATPYGINATLTMQKTNSGFADRLNDKMGVYYFHWSRLDITPESELKNLDNLLEIINLAKEIIKRCQTQLGEKESNAEIDDAIRQIDNLYKAYKETEKDLEFIELSQSLDALKLNQEKILKTLAEVVDEQKSLRKEVEKKANSSDIHTVNLHPLQQQIAQLISSVNEINKTPTPAPASDKSSNTFSFLSKKR